MTKRSHEITNHKVKPATKCIYDDHMMFFGPAFCPCCSYWQIINEAVDQGRSGNINLPPRFKARKKREEDEQEMGKREGNLKQSAAEKQGDGKRHTCRFASAG